MNKRRLKGWKPRSEVELQRFCADMAVKLTVGTQLVSTDVELVVTLLSGIASGLDPGQSFGFRKQRGQHGPIFNPDEIGHAYILVSMWNLIHIENLSKTEAAQRLIRALRVPVTERVLLNYWNKFAAKLESTVMK